MDAASPSSVPKAPGAGKAAQCKSGSLIKWEVLVETQTQVHEEVRRIVRKKPLRLVFSIL